MENTSKLMFSRCSLARHVTLTEPLSLGWPGLKENQQMKNLL